MATLARVYSAQVIGLRSHVITIEVDTFRGFHTFSVVGLPDKAVEESRDRIGSAIKSTGFKSPKSRGQQKVVVALAPADLKKEGPLFDVPMALGYLNAIGDIRFNPEKKIFLGELSLSGELQPIKGALLLAKKAKEEGFEELYLPQDNAEEAALIRGIRIFGARTLGEIIRHVNTKHLDAETALCIDSEEPLAAQPKTVLSSKRGEAYPVELSDIKGNEHAKRGLEIAAAGAHNIAFYGPPGTGKTLLAKALISILPPLTFDEALAVTGIHSTAGTLSDPLITLPPFRAPHHTSSYISVIGGGAFPMPGEATLAHKGILFMDEFPEFDRRVIESLRGPLEDGVIHIARARGREMFPAEFMLVAALNPCPCGFKGDRRKECVCTQGSLLGYQRKISGPIIDRIDMWIEIPRIDHRELSRTDKDKADADRAAAAKERIVSARKLQQARFEKHASNVTTNSRMGVKELERFVALSEETRACLNTVAKKFDLSARAYHRIIKLARTIADIEECADVLENHILEAAQYRPRELFYKVG